LVRARGFRKRVKYRIGHAQSVARNARTSKHQAATTIWIVDLWMIGLMDE
jgi:hypothetical protein